MSKERLEEIMNTQYQFIEVSKTNMQEDFNYLLIYINNLEMAFDDLDSDYIDLTEQNKRYREALVEIINARNHFYPTEYVFGVEGIARQALEGEE